MSIVGWRIHFPRSKMPRTVSKLLTLAPLQAPTVAARS